jgi:hypothetical protein
MTVLLAVVPSLLVPLLWRGEHALVTVVFAGLRVVAVSVLVVGVVAVLTLIGHAPTTVMRWTWAVSLGVASIGLIVAGVANFVPPRWPGELRPPGRQTTNGRPKGGLMQLNVSELFNSNGRLLHDAAVDRAAAPVRRLRRGRVNAGLRSERNVYQLPPSTPVISALSPERARQLIADAHRAAAAASSLDSRDPAGE